jgi:hypothetical protein
MTSDNRRHVLSIPNMERCEIPKTSYALVGLFEKNETFAPKLSQSECQWYHLKACLKNFTMSTNVEGFW